MDKTAETQVQSALTLLEIHANFSTYETINPTTQENKNEEYN